MADILKVGAAGIGGNIGLVGVDVVLQTIGFNNAADHLGMMHSGIGEFEDFWYLVEKDIRDMADEFGKCTQGNGRIVFDLGRIKKLVGAVHWVQGCYQTNDAPDHNNFNDAALNDALCLSQVRKSDIELVSPNTKAIDPGKFMDTRRWLEWEKAFTNNLAVISGVSGIPLSYVIREEGTPEEEREYASYNEMIVRAPRNGQFYLADTRRRVRNLLLGFLQGENTENWIRRVAK